MLSVKELTEQLSIREFVRIATVVDEHVRVANTKFDVLRIAREGNGMAVWVDCGKAKLFWVVINEGEKAVVQTKIWNRAA